MLEDLMRSSKDLRDKFGLDQNSDTAISAQLRKLAEEHYEFVSAVTGFDVLSWLEKQEGRLVVNEFLPETYKSSIAEEFVDNIVVMLNIMALAGIDKEDISRAVTKVILKNYYKTQDTHYVKDGMIVKKEA